MKGRSSAEVKFVESCMPNGIASSVTERARGKEPLVSYTVRLTRLVGTKKSARARILKKNIELGAEGDASGA